jgi:hypothetical protein
MLDDEVGKGVCVVNVVAEIRKWTLLALRNELRGGLRLRTEVDEACEVG